MIELTRDQQKVVDDVIDWYINGSTDYITVGGYAGTGKTSIIPFIADFLRTRRRFFKIAFCSFTGKAVSVLKNKIRGILTDDDTISTIHGLMYYPEYKTNKQGKKVIVGWKRKGNIDYDLIIIDEGSMVNGYIWNDLLSYRIPIIVIGDHGQLPPVGEKYGLLQNPDLKLLKIHRQAKNNPIINLSINIRRNGYIQHGIYNKNVFKISWRDPKCIDLFNKISWNSDTISLCGFNSTRVKINKIIRDKQQFTLDEPYPGERLICLKNNHHTKIMNGQIGSVVWFTPSPRNTELYNITLKMDQNDELYETLIWKECFNKESYSDTYEMNLNRRFAKDLKREDIESVDLFDFGYAISVHRSQGSEWDRVICFEQRSKYWDDEYFKKWLYTAVTRSKKKLFIISDFY